ncbi:MAG: hypothetical protein K9L17_14145 [Clostridiales bacterium]|nr:hypothetical protein [Clostridiales bacterium]MCF8023811.1 hypothetical protein [Clostridiales bacterium]
MELAKKINEFNESEKEFFANGRFTFKNSTVVEDKNKDSILLYKICPVCGNYSPPKKLEMFIDRKFNEIIKYIFIDRDFNEIIKYIIEDRPIFCSLECYRNFKLGKLITVKRLEVRPGYDTTFQIYFSNNLKMGLIRRDMETEESLKKILVNCRTVGDVESLDEKENIYYD